MGLRKRAFILLGLAFLFFGVDWPESSFGRAAVHGDARPGRMELAAAWPGPRPFEGFLTDLPTLSSGSIPEGSGDEAAVIARQIEDAADTRGAAADWADLAAVALLSGDPERAVSLLNEAARLAPDDPRISSDLAVAYLARAEQESNPLPDWIQALAAANRALRKDPRLPQALCNRALILEKIPLPSEARRAWKGCLQSREGNEDLLPWDDLAPHWMRSRPVAPAPQPDLREIALAGGAAALRTAVAASPHNARVAAERELAFWADAFLQGDGARAGMSLAIAGSLGEILWQVSGDALIRDTVAGIFQSSQEGRRALLARGIVDYQTGWELHEQSRQSEASPLLAAAQAQLTAAGSPYQARAAYVLAVSECYQGLKEKALGRLRPVVSRARQAGYITLLAESLWMTGHIEADLDRPADALDALRGSLASFEAAGGLEGVAGAKNMMAELLDDLGAYREAWRSRRDALQAAGRIAFPKRQYQIYSVAARAAFREGLPEAALDFQNEALLHAAGVNAQAVCEALFWRSRFWQRLGQLDLATRDLHEARQRAEQISDPSARNRIEADLLLAEAELRLPASPADAVRLFSKALDHFSRLNHKATYLDLLLLRSRALRALGRWREAETDVEEAIRFVESWRSETLERELRISVLDGMKEAYDEMILLQVEVNADPPAALDFLEGKRGRVLLDQLLDAQTGGADVLSVADWAGRLPQEAVLLTYARVRDRLLVWVVDRGGVRAFHNFGRAAELDAPARRILSAAHGERVPRAWIDAAAEDLYDRLIRPIRESLPPGAYLVVSRDDLLSGVPFSLLRDRETGRYLIEDHPVAMAPSANSYVLSLARLRAQEKEAEGRALFVGAPDFDSAAFPELRPLAGALRETQRMASLYGSAADALIRAEATREAFLDHLPGSSLVQFSGHAKVNPKFPLASALLFTPSTGGDGTLQAGDILPLRLKRTRLVILAACGSAEGASSRSEGVESLSRAFLTAGVPAVIGTLWDVDDEASTEILLELHRRLRRGQDAAASLQAAQIRLLKSEETTWRSPLVWAGFELIGSAAKPAT